MYRFLFRTVYAARNSSLTVYESCVLPAKCDKAAAPVFRISNGGGIKALSSSSVRLCEKKNDAVASNQDEKTHADKEADQTESPALETQKAGDDSTVMQMAEQTEPEPAAVKTEDGGTSKPQVDAETEKVAATPKQVETTAAKSGKAGLLDLLGAMKVDVTNKRKLKKLKGPPSNEPKPKPEAMESTISMFQKATEEASSSQSETLNPELVAAASAAASTRPDPNQAVSELLRQLRKHESVTEAQKKGDMSNLGVIIADMKVGRKASRGNARPAHQIQFDDDGRGYTLDRGITAELDGIRRRRNLFSGKRLNIFSPAAAAEDAVETVARPTLWDIDFAQQLSRSLNLKPRNGFDEMIQWTKEGKLWQYPVNNEAGLEEEASVPFHEHVFLERHLEDGFPSSGPVRHFMELVLAGLSRNPYLTVQQKQEHISWFRDFFNQNLEDQEAGVSHN